MNNKYAGYLDEIENKFLKCFNDKKYTIETAVNITSKIDSTVDFVGSKISPLKHYILEDNVGNPGRCLIQNCIKLKSLNQLKTTDNRMFGGYYKCMGVLAIPDLERITFDLFDYLTNPCYLGISKNDLCIRICSKDKDLMDAITSVDSKIYREVDTVSMEHYRHVYGMDEQGITGRDYNIGLRRKGTEQFINCGTFVVMENANGPLAVDMGLGNLTFSMCHFGNTTSASSSRMADVINITSVEDNKMADVLMIIAALLREDITSSSSKHFKKKFRQYMNVMSFWNQSLQLTPEFITNTIIWYLQLEYSEDFSDRRAMWEKLMFDCLNRYKVNNDE